MAGTGAVAGLAGCLGSPGGSDSFRIGYLNVLSGPSGLLGEVASRGYSLAQDEINEQGGFDGREIEILERDSEVNPEVAVQRARELVEQQNVDVVMGMTSSAVVKAVGTYTEEQNVPLIVTGAGSKDVTTVDCAKNKFMYAIDLRQDNSALALAMSRIVDADRMAAIAPDYSFGHQTWDWFQQKYREFVGHDVTVTAELFPQLGKGNYENEIQSLLDGDPDLVYSSIFGGDMGAFIEQAKQVGFFESIPEVALGPGGAMNIMRPLGENGESMIAVDPYYYNYPQTQLNRRFVQNYREEYEEIPINFSGVGYGAVYALNEAIESEGGSTSSDIVAGLEGLEHEAPHGTITIRESDHNSIPDNIIVGRLGYIDELGYYGYQDIFPQPGQEVTPEPDPNCQLHTEDF